MAEGVPSGSNQKPKGVPGKWIVLIVFGGAFLMWLPVFLIGLRERRAHAGHEGAEITTTAEQIRPLLRSLPERWSKVTLVEGQGWVLYVPCYSSNSEAVFRTAPDSAPGIACEYCDSLDAFKVRAVARDRADSVWYLKLEPEAGDLRILPVDDSLLKAFPEAPFQDRIMLWTRQRAGGKTDSMIFVPKSQESEFETLRAEDENPEGCGGNDPD
jgi:hypothetical protein